MTDYLSTSKAEFSNSQHLQHLAAVNVPAGETWRGGGGLLSADVIDQLQLNTLVGWLVAGFAVAQRENS